MRPRNGLLAMVFIVVVVAAANVPALTGYADTSPLLLEAGLASNLKFGPLPGLPSIDPNDGFTLQALGHLAAADIVHGKSPWWDPYEGLGAPLAGEMQAAALFPLTFLELVSHGVLYFHLLLEVAAALATYWLLRRLGLSTMAATLGGVLFGLNGTFAWLGNAAATPVALLPLLLTGVELCRSSTKHVRIFGVALSATALALSIYAGFPETTAIDTGFAAYWALLRVKGLGPSQTPRYALALLASGLLGLLLAAPIIDAFLTYLPFADVGLHAGGVGTAALPRTAAAMLSLPYVFGPIFAFVANDRLPTLGIIWSNVGGFTTSGVVILASLALVSALRRKQDQLLVVGLLGYTGLCLIKTFNVASIGTVLGRLPALDAVAFYRYAPPSWELALVVVASIGFEEICNHSLPHRVSLVAGALAVAFTLGEAAVAFHQWLEMTHTQEVNIFFFGSLAIGIGVVVVITLLITFRTMSERILGSSPPLWIGAIVALEAVCLFALPQLSAPRSGVVDLQPVRFLQTHLGSYRFASLGPIAPDYGSYFGLSEINVNDVPIPARFASFISAHLDSNVNPLIFTGTSQATTSGLSPLQAFVTNIAGYESAAVKYILLPPTAAAEAQLRRAHLRRVFQDSVAAIFVLPGVAPFSSSATGACEVRDISNTRFTSVCTAPGEVVRRELYFKGWRATENGRAVSVTAYSHVFQEVHVPKGTARVRFEFDPPYMPEALLALLAGMAALAAICGWALGAKGSRSDPLGRLDTDHRLDSGPVGSQRGAGDA